MANDRITHPPTAAIPSPQAIAPRPLLALGALAAGFGLTQPAWAQTAATTEPPAAETKDAGKDTGKDAALPKITVRGRTETPAKETLQATRSSIGKGDQALRDIPQSVTVVTERLIDDRNLDTFKEALKNTAGISFQAAEGGEEDIRLRGFSLQTTGDIFIDGMRDAAFYDRDSFNWDRLELLRGSASMLFGRGSTGGAANQVSKQAQLIDENEVNLTLGSHRYKRITTDFNVRTDENAALRLTAMRTEADSNGAGTRLDKTGIAGNYRAGIGTADEFSVTLFHLSNDNGINYGLPWIKPTASAADTERGPITSLDPNAYYGMASDYNHGTATTASLSHRHRLDDGSTLKTTLRQGSYTRDMRASTIRLCTQTTNATTGAVTNPGCPTTTPTLDTFGDSTIFTRGTQLKIQDLKTLQAQSDYDTRFTLAGMRHEMQTGIDWAREEKTVYGSATTLTKPRTLAGTADDGAWVDESSRVLRQTSRFVNIAAGVYAQDLVEFMPDWKLLGGLRYDRMHGEFEQTPLTGSAARYEQRIGEFSKRAGLLWQPDEQRSFHFSWGTSFNTSGDSYSYNAQSANTDPEQSENLELGAKIDSADGRFTSRFALFRSTKKNERNTDPDSAATALLLSGQRHSTGIDMDFNGLLTSKWELFVSYMWIPFAKVDQAAPTATTFGNRQGDRPGLTPKHSGTIWNSYQLTSDLRIGAGLNFRSRTTPADQAVASAVQAPGYSTWDLMAEYEVIPYQFIVKANLNNVANKLYADSLYRGHYVPGPGRVLQLTGTLKF